MAAITLSTARKTVALDKLYSASAENKFLDPNEFGARVKQAEIAYTAAGAVTTSTPVVLARFDRPVTLKALVLVTSSGITTVNIGTTPISLPVDTTTNIASASTALASANVIANFAGAVNVDLTEPTILFLIPASGSLADTHSLKGYVLYTDNT